MFVEPRLTGRFIELDIVRGVALLAMIAFHALVDLSFLGAIQFDPDGAFATVAAAVIGSTFLLLVGISLTISRSRAARRMSEGAVRMRFLKRGMILLSLGLAITLVTKLFLESGFVVFGIIHCIGASVILAYPFLKRPITSMVLGTAVVLVGVYLYTTTWDFQYLVFFGFRPNNFFTIDYYPLLPWFGVVLFGVFIGYRIYPNGERKRSTSPWFERDDPLVAVLGRNSLAIYLVHQPILLGIISLILLIR